MRNKQLKTGQLLNETFFSRKNLMQKPSKFQYYVVCQLRNLIYYLNACYLIHTLEYTQNVWAVGFRPLLKQITFH